MIEQYWQKFIHQYPQYQNKNYVSFAFCGEGHPMADELAHLTKTGVKQATSSLVILYEETGEQLPQVGDISIILDSQNRPVCIIENQKITILPYNKMDASHALKEGEGDKSYTYWKEMHDAFFSSYLKEYHLPFSEELLVCFEEFKVIYI